MKVALIINKHNIFLNLYLKYLKSIPKKNIIIIFENSNFPKRDKEIINSRLSINFKQKLNSKALPNINNYIYKNFKSINSTSFLNFIKKEKILFILNGGIMEIVKKNYLFNKIVNVHPAYLPKYRGCSCPEWSIYYGDKPAITIHLIGRKIDHGPIIKRKFVKVKYKNYKFLRSKLYLESIIQGCRMLIDIYIKNGLNKKKLIYQKKKDGNYFKPMPKKIFKNINLKN